MSSIYVAYDIINALVVFVAFWFFGNLMPLKPRNKYFVFTIYILVYLLCMGTGMLRRVDFMNNPIGNISMTVAYFAIQFMSIVFLYDAKLKNKFFFFFINKICECAGLALTDYAISFLPEEIIYSLSIRQSLTDWRVLSLYLFTTVAVFFIELLVVFIAKSKERRVKSSILESIAFLLVPASQFILYFQALVLTAESNYYYRRMGNIWLLLGALMSVFGDFALFITIRKLKKMNLLEKRMTSIETQMNKSIEDLEEIESISKRQNMIFHDLKNQVVAFGIMMDKNDLAHAKEQLEEISGLVRKFEDKTFCENKVVNAILNYKEHIANSKHIKVDIDVKISDELSIAGADLCSVFSNIFDNAIEAAGMLENLEDRYIKLKCKQTHGYLLIIQENKLPLKPTAPLKDDGAVHGLGLSILKFIAEKYEGTFEYEMKEGKFLLKMNIPLPA